MSRFVIRRLKNPSESEFDRILTISKNFWVFWQHAPTPSTERKRYFLFQKPSSAYFKTWPYLFSDLWEAHEQIGTNIRKWGAQKLEKCEGGCVGFRDPKFLNEKKSKSTMQKTVCNLVEGKWVKIEHFWLTLYKNGLNIPVGLSKPRCLVFLINF